MAGGCGEHRILCEHRPCESGDFPVAFRLLSLPTRSGAGREREAEIKKEREGEREREREIDFTPLGREFFSTNVEDDHTFLNSRILTNICSK